MPRAKRGFKRRRRTKKVFQKTEGFMLGWNNQYRRAVEAMRRSSVYAFRDRRRRKRLFRELWVTRINAAAVANDMSYSRFIAALKKSQVALDRKVLSDIAIFDPTGFSAIVGEVKAASPQF